MQPEIVSTWADADPYDCLFKTEIVQHMHCIGTDLNTDPNLREHRSMLVYFYLVSGLHQA